MPIYEYRCQDCRRRVSVFVRSMNSPVTAACDRCGSGRLQRLISRVAVLRSGEGAMSGSSPEAAFADVDQNDPRSMARWVRRMSQDMGEPMDSAMEAELERMEAGEMPDEFAGEDVAEDAFLSDYEDE